MKKIKYIVFASLLGLASCKKDELELFPYNQIETSQAFNTEADVNLAINGMYAGLRGSGSYFVAGTWNIVADVMADNAIINQTGRLTLKTFGEWRYTGENTFGLFSGGYGMIRRANAILENIEKFADGPFKNNTKGEALALRAMIYFDMARVYSKTYLNATTTDSTMGYVTTTDPTLLLTKEPVRDFYNKVIADLETAKNLIGTTNGIFRLNKNAVSGLLSRVYLYKGDWANCIAASNDALGATPVVPSRTDFPGIWTDATNNGVLFKVRNTTLDNINSQGVNYYQTVGGERKSEYNIDYNFKQLFTATDVRTTSYLATSPFNGVNYTHIIKYNGRTGGVAGVVDGKVIRTAEVLLNRAEAYYRSSPSNPTAALADLVLLKSNRYSGYTPDVLSGQPLLDEILAERRLELAFEGDRFWDLKRRNLPVVRDATKGERADGTGTPYVFTSLPIGDYRFQLPFPVSETNFNSGFKNNPGY
jgi:starch-binding outer membrane protein, SusD/RagB family